MTEGIGRLLGHILNPEPAGGPPFVHTMPSVVYDGRYSQDCANGCVEGTCGAPRCGGCCRCLGGCTAGYHEQVEAATAADDGPAEPSVEAL